MIALIGAGDFLVLPSSRPQNPEESANAMTSIGSSPWQAQPRAMMNARNDANFMCVTARGTNGRSISRVQEACSFEFNQKLLRP
ncbi:hypothetical protein N3K66_002310 [Trichothecium roseum]|uniref:Uncharacterized protein n=1 Tax=Trichothecium roseum TaxID=47278 RepID=A0ACC0VB15_9HYPO|nr:hypothetical protein N3K66_002310 [Trichothecium roseum]